MSFLTFIAQAIRRLRVVKGFIKSTKDPEYYQKKFLRNLIRKNKNTPFGKRYHFSKISNINDFQRYVPIKKYEEIKQIEKIKGKGDQYILTHDKVFMFGMTSGTTGTPKYVPITHKFVNQYQRNWDIWTYYCYKSHPSLFRGKILTMVGVDKEGFTKSGIPYGSISGVINNNQTSIIKHFFSIPYFVYTIKDYDAKYYCILRIALEQEISAIITPNPSMILILCKKIEEYKEDIFMDIENGTLSKKYNIEENVREKLKFKPNPKRALELIHIDKSKQGLIPKDIWKFLSVVGCWKEGTLPIYLRQFPKYFGKIPVRDIGLISTEGQSSISISDEATGGVLTVDSLFFEFIKTNQIHKKNKRIYLVWELEMDEEYFMVITNISGLYRYFTDDIIKVVGFYNKTPIIQFMHKGAHVTSITGEKITEWQVVTAMRFASKRLEVPVHEFTVCAKFGKTPRYDILLELHEKCDLKRLKKLIVLFDDELKKLNIEYNKKRQSERLGKPILKIVHSNGYSKLHRKKTEAGAHDAQVKIPSLTEDPEFESQFDIKTVVTN